MSAFQKKVHSRFFWGAGSVDDGSRSRGKWFVWGPVADCNEHDKETGFCKTREVCDLMSDHFASQHVP
jgi:hypothetical protein